MTAAELAELDTAVAMRLQAAHRLFVGPTAEGDWTAWGGGLPNNYEIRGETPAIAIYRAVVALSAAR